MIFGWLWRILMGMQVQISQGTPPAQKCVDYVFYDSLTGDDSDINLGKTVYVGSKTCELKCKRFMFRLGHLVFCQGVKPDTF